jgi:hypothetical protein
MRQLGRKFTFAEIVRAFDPLEIDFGHGVDIGVLHIESGSVSRIKGMCQKRSRHSFGRVHPEGHSRAEKRV